MLYQNAFGFAVFSGHNSGYVQHVCINEKQYLDILQEKRGHSDCVCYREEELMARSIYLHLYVQFYIGEMRSDKFLERFAGVQTKNVISDRLDKILLIRKGMGELPINLADLYYAAVILSCYILNRKEEAEIQEADYSHVNLGHSDSSMLLAKTIKEFNDKIK